MRNYIVANLIFIIFLCGCSSTSKQTKIKEPETALTQVSCVNQSPDYVSMAEELVSMGHYKLALANLNSAPKNIEKDPAYFCLLGECNRYLGNYNSAERYYHQAIKLDKYYAQAYNGLGFVYSYTKKDDKKIEAFKLAVSCNPGRADLLNNLGYAYFEKGMLDEAVDCFNRSIALAPDFKIPIINLGYILGMASRYDESLKTFLRVISIDKALNNIGVIYERKGKPDKAVVMYRKALQENPGLHEAESNLLRIEKVVPVKGDKNEI